MSQASPAGPAAKASQPDPATSQTEAVPDVQPKARSGRGRRAIEIVLRIAFLLTLLGLWELSARAWGSSLTFPPASAVAVALSELVVQGETWMAAWVTLQAFIWGFGLALIIGLLTGLAAARYEVADRLTAIHLRILLTAPLAPVVPLMIGFFGIGLTARVALVFLFSVAVIAINTQTGIRQVDPQLIEMSESFGIGEISTFRRVRLPGAVPAIMAGLRLGAARGVVGMVVAELIIVSVGLGRLLNFYRGRFQAAEMFAIVIIILAMGVSILVVVKLTERRLTAWKR